GAAISARSRGADQPQPARFFAATPMTHGRPPWVFFRPPRGSAMGQKIERNHQRFRKLVRGKVKSNLSKYISRGEMIGKKGKDLVSIPLPQIDIPQFRYGQKGSGGVGQGDGQPGQPLGPGQGEPSSGAGD